MEELVAFQELQRRVETARVALENHPNHELKYGQVMSILSMFGLYIPEDWPHHPPLSEEEQRVAVLGRDRRRWNALLCAEKIIDFWSFSIVEPHLSPDRVSYMLLSERVDKLCSLDLRKQLEDAKVDVLLQERKFLNQFSWMGEEVEGWLLEESRVFTAVYQATSAHSNVDWAIGGAYWNEYNIFDANKIYPDEWDCDWSEVPLAIYASYTWAGRPNSTGPLDDPQARKDFWLWWLDEAVPASWNLECL